MIGVKESCCPLRSIPSKADRLPSILIFCILFFLIASISGAVLGCAPKQMSLDEAKQTAISMRGKMFVPPPRSIDDILDMLDKEKVNQFATGKNLFEILKSEPSTGASGMQLYKFYFDRGEAAIALGYLDQGLHDFQKAYEIAIVEKFDKKGGQYLQIVNRLSVIERSLGNYEKAIALLKTMNKNMGLYYQLTQIYTEIGDFDEAAKIYGQGILFFNKFEKNLDYRSRLSFARMQYVYIESLGRYNKAEEFHRNALHQASSYKESRPDLLIWEKRALAFNLLKQNRLIEAETMARQVIADSVRLSGVESIRLVNYLQLLAEIVLVQGKLKQAEEIVRVAIQLNENFGVSSESRNFCISKNTLGRILVAAGDYSGAAKQFDFFREKEHSNFYLYNIHYARNMDVMLSLAMTGRSKEAMFLIENEYRRSQTAFGENSLRTAFLLAIRGIARKKSDELSLAHADLAAAVPIIAKKAENREILTVDYRVRIIMESYLELLEKIKQSALEKRLGIDASVEAFQTAEVLRNRAVQGSLLASAARMRIEDKALAELVRSEQDVNMQISAYQNLIQDIFSRPSSDHYQQDIERLKPTIEKLSAARDTILDEIQKHFPDYANMLRPRRQILSEVQKQLRPEEAIISIYSTDANTFVWAVLNQGAPVMSVVNLPKNDLEKKVSELRSSLFPVSDTLGQLPAYDFQKAYELYSLLLQPSEQFWREAKDVILLASGPMGQIPLAVLPTRGFQLEPENGELFSNYRDAPWLIRNYSITTVPSLSSFVSLRSLPTGAQTRKAFAGFGDPYFNKNQMLNALNEEKGLNISHPDGGYKLNVRGIRITENGSLDRKNILSCNIESLNRLPDTAQEIQSIAAVLGATPEDDIYLGVRASEKQVKSMNLSDRRVIAFASHALVPYDLDGLDQPAIALSAPSVTGEEGDGLLTMAEILDLKLNADWVVLSACNTGAADGVGAEAVSGLGRAFFYAGTKSLLVSMWPVETTSAKILTTTLFRHLKDDPGLTKAQAQQRAMLSLIGGPGMLDEDGRTIASYAHPFFWAPFVIVGENGMGHFN